MQQIVAIFLVYSKSRVLTKLLGQFPTICWKTPLNIIIIEKGVNGMTLDEVAQVLGCKKNTLVQNFPRCQRTLAKKGIILMKWGWGKKAEYEIEYEDRDEEE